ncbi:MAG TPA: CHASE2 domain-containing protein [Tepidisphaeraceae bacterium]|jgi:CHASE2 domain-containing sensor protein|nr:CHASE2 domain-containing protein [Tepidisphaeraceae bacterium]
MLISKRNLRTIFYTVVLTSVALIAEYHGVFARMENYFYDLRAQLCQRHIPPPTDRLVHLDIDDAAVEAVGRWPWDRDDMAEMVEEIRLAGAKVLVLDVLYAEPTSLTYDARGNKHDPDASLAEEIRKFDGVILPASIMPGPAVASTPLYAQIAAEMQAGVHDADAIKRKIIPSADPTIIGPAERDFDRAYERVSRDRAFSRITISPPAGMPPVLSASDALVPLADFSNAAKQGAFLDYLPDHSDGVVRQAPLVCEYHGRLIPQLGLAAACAMLDVDPARLRYSHDTIIIPQPGGDDIRIPVTSRMVRGLGEVGMLMEVPMFGQKEDWETMYDVPNHKVIARHLSMQSVWAACQTRRRLASNNAAADDLLSQALFKLDGNSGRAAEYTAHPLRGAEQEALIDKTIDELHDLIDAMSNASVDPSERQTLETFKRCETQLRAVKQANVGLNRELVRERNELAARLGGRAVFVGGTATGIADIVPTALHTRCPGVVIHGAVFNAIMTRKLWRVAPRYITIMIMILFAIIAGVMVIRLSPIRATVGMIVLSIGYVAMNGYVLFDAYNLIVGVTGPLLVALLVWLVMITQLMAQNARPARAGG